MLRTLDIEASPAAEPLLEGGRRPPQRRHGAADRLPAAELEVEAAAAHPIRSPPLGRRRCLPVPASPHDWLTERRSALDEGLRRLAAAARAGAIADGNIEDSVLRVERTETAVPDGAADVVADLYGRLPEARITDILLEVDDRHPVHRGLHGEPCRDRIGLLNVLLAEGINLGLRKMADATTTHGFWEVDARPRCRVSDHRGGLVMTGSKRPDESFYSPPVGVPLGESD